MTDRGEAGGAERGGDGLDDVVLDEDFVRGATIHEAGADARRNPPSLPPAPRRPLPARRNVAQRSVDRVREHWRDLLVAVAAVAVLALVGRALFLPSTHPTATGSNASGTSTTEVGLSRRDYGSGDCVIWDQSAAAGQERATHVVPCTQPHLVEIVGMAVAKDSASYAASGPTTAQWDAIYHQQCMPLIVRFLGTSLDPNGRFAAGGIQPSPESWLQGDREMWCGIEARSPNGQEPTPGRSTPFTGEAKGASQAYLYRAGTCFADHPGPSSSSVVPCAAGHAIEVTGTVELPSTVTTAPRDPTAWSHAIGPACLHLAVAYHGGPLPPGLQADWLPIPPSSWTAGQRSLNCIVARFVAGRLVSVRGTARAGHVPR